ncbi:MAG: hypothetical protein ISR83_01725 [Candidatus Marinimicrobia bacterium]|nr:hypothetical protein [Candidatus Neomarinimicrobiota bacterium]
MKKLLTAKELRQKYRPDEILMDIQSSFNDNKSKIIDLFSLPGSPLEKYKRKKQLSILVEEKPIDDFTIIHELVDTLSDAIYFMTLSKSKRTKASQRLRMFESQLIENQLLRINLLLEDEELGSPTPWTDEKGQIKMASSHHGLDMAFEILSLVKVDLEEESYYWNNITRTGYLTGLQLSMGSFFHYLKNLGMAQKDQITLVQQLFDVLKVDWDEGERENIKISLQQPALILYDEKQRLIESKRNVSTFPKHLNKNIIDEITELSANYKKRLRRF